MINFINQHKIKIHIGLIILLVLIFRHYILNHKDFFEILFKTITIIIACLALSTWKNEIKAKKIYALSTSIYSILQDIQSKIRDLGTMNGFCYDEAGAISSIMCYFFRENKTKLNNLLGDSRRIKLDTKYIQYFCNLAEKYSQKDSDYPFFQEKYINPETGQEEYNVDNFKHWFWSDYTKQVSDNKYCEFHYEFDSNLEKALDFYNQKIAKYYD